MISPHLIPKFEPSANPEAIVHLTNIRITVLTTRLFRIEYSQTDQFEDCPSQIFWYRNHQVPNFKVEKSKGQNNNQSGTLKIETPDLLLRYSLGKKLSSDSLSILIKSINQIWRFGDPNHGNLKGTYRTLDERDGQVELENGLISRDGWTIIDDSQTLVFNEHGWMEQRKGKETNLDYYFFGYGYDFQACIKDYRKLTGAVPLLPRWALGNWWSRYWAYDHEQILNLIHEFKYHGVPLSVFIVDMDWHITDTGNDSSGWTGYTWNHNLFPNPTQFIENIHRMGLRTALNLHPAAGVYPHEDAYSDFAELMGVDPTSQTPIPFDLADQKFTRAYFELLHHPLEADGIDFWWIDWQQGNQLSIPGLDPLWWLNHLHFIDHARSREDDINSSNRRPFIFSRWGGLGNHRYPIGFSGDTIISWESLAYQPYFTATAANVCYGWWSHDIGGHMTGVEDPELYTRWVQYGLFSPIFRLHCTKNPYHERRPFAYDAETSRLTCHALRLRHSFIPYLYTMAWLDHQEALTPIRPLYHLEPNEEPAYYAPDTYTFGTELIAAPHTRPLDAEIGLSRQKVWLPEGNWYNFFTGDPIPSGHHVSYGSLPEIPLFAKAGAIVPVLPLPKWGGLEIPSHLQIIIFPGADNHFTLYEDDGTSTKYLEKEYTRTPFRLIHEIVRMEFHIGPVVGNFDQFPKQRTFELKFMNILEPDTCLMELNQKTHLILPEYNRDNKTLIIPIESKVTPEDHLRIILQRKSRIVDDQDRFYQTLKTCSKVLSYLAIDTYAKSVITNLLPEIIENPVLISQFRPTLTDTQLRALLEIITRTGVHRISHTGEDSVQLWNENPLQDSFPVTYHLTVNQYHRGYYEHHFYHEYGPVPKFKVFLPGIHFEQNPWELRLNYGSVLTITKSSKDQIP